MGRPNPAAIIFVAQGDSHQDGRRIHANDDQREKDEAILVRHLDAKLLALP
jgi:hypothetical protein